MAMADSFLPTLMEALRLPFSPLIELAHAFTGLDMEAAAAASGSRIHRKLLEFNNRLEALYLDRDHLLGRLDSGDISPQDVARLHQLAAHFRSLGEAYRADLEEDPHLTEITQRAAHQLEGWAQDLERAFLGDQPQHHGATVAMPDAKLLTALDRLGFGLDDLENLTTKVINEKYRARARRFHPDTKEAEDRAFYEEEMKKLNEAKDLLMQTAR